MDAPRPWPTTQRTRPGRSQRRRRGGSCQSSSRSSPRLTRVLLVVARGDRRTARAGRRTEPTVDSLSPRRPGIGGNGGGCFASEASSEAWYRSSCAVRRPLWHHSSSAPGPELDRVPEGEDTRGRGHRDGEGDGCCACSVHVTLTSGSGICTVDGTTGSASCAPARGKDFARNRRWSTEPRLRTYDLPHASSRRRRRRRDRRASRRRPSQRGIRGDTCRDRRGGSAAPPVDFVLLDVRLPDIDGFSICRELRARSEVADHHGHRERRGDRSRRRASSSAPMTMSSSLSVSASWWRESGPFCVAARPEGTGDETLSVGALEVDVPARRAISPDASSA